MNFLHETMSNSDKELFLFEVTIFYSDKEGSNPDKEVSNSDKEDSFFKAKIYYSEQTTFYSDKAG